MSIEVTVIAISVRKAEPVIITRLGTCGEAAADIRHFATQRKIDLPPSPHYGDHLLEVAKSIMGATKPVELTGVLATKLYQSGWKLWMQVF